MQSNAEYRMSDIAACLSPAYLCPGCPGCPVPELVGWAPGDPFPEND